YEGIKLGMSMKEVQYIKGQPKGLTKDKEFLAVGFGNFNKGGGFISTLEDPEKIKANDSIFNYPKWNFDGDKIRLDVDFDKPNGTVVAVTCSIPPWVEYSNKGGEDCEPLSGITR